jgi:hypothetical protein
MRPGTILLSIPLFFVSSAAAQVVYSVGTQQVYDSNIFLESGSAPQGLPEDVELLKEFDGKKNSDFISNPYVSAAGRVNLSPKLVTAFNARLGAILFADNGRENRFAVDAMFSVTPEEGVLPPQWTFFLTEALTSQANAVGIAQGATTRQGQLNTISIGGGLNNYELTARNRLTATVSSSRQDFLGQFLFSSNDDNERREIQGVDSFIHSFLTRVDHQFDERFSIFAANNLNYFDATGGQTNNFGAFDVDDQDRLNNSVSAGVMYRLTEKLQAGASVGNDLSSFSRSQTASGIERDNTQSNLFYGANLNYLASERAVLGLNVMQSGASDIDGSRIIVRAASLNGSYMLSNALTAMVSGVFSQFERGDSLSNSTDRYEALANVRYSVTDYLALSLGYGYVKQEAGGSSAQLFNGGDFDGHRAFFSIDTGFMALAR